MTPLVLKIGGSLAESGRMAGVLDTVMSRAGRPIVIVPGGGPFADAVRRAQSFLGFSDIEAHRKALLAMHRMAAVMRGWRPDLAAAETLAAMRAAWAEARTPVWLPAKLCGRDRCIPQDWSITSDGLAARLAERLGDASVALVKSCPVERTADAGELARRGIVDATFPEIVARAALDWTVIGAGEEGALERLISARPPQRGPHAPSPEGAGSTARR